MLVIQSCYTGIAPIGKVSIQRTNEFWNPLIYNIEIYISFSVRIEGIKIHAGVTLATECIQSFSSGSTVSHRSEMAASTLNVRRIAQIGVGGDSSRFQLSMINRQSFTSAVAGIMSYTNMNREDMLKLFCDEVDKTAANAKARNFNKKDMKQFDDSVWKLTASLILMKPNLDEKQLFYLTRAPVILFHPDAMRTIGKY